MDFSTPELKAFKAVIKEPGMGIREFMNKTKFSKPNAYYVLRHLKSKRLMESAGKPAKYTIPENEKTVQLSHLFKLYGPYRIENALSKKNYPLLREILYEGKTAEELIKTTGVSRSQTYKIMSKFAIMGLVRNFNDQFYISTDHPLYKCLLEYENPKKLNAELEKDGAIIWQGDGEYLIQTDDHKEYIVGLKYPWRFTSTSAVGEYGINIIPPTTTLYVADQTTPIIENSNGEYTSLEDTIIFTLLHDTRDSKTYARYMILLHKDKIDLNNLRQKARKYKINEIVESILYDLKPIIRE
ncbi:MAG: hypothetical protein KKD39_01435 [Candidatus Altiarchaeota archaeon]|nr:hypothetical protein [Candidatus Altiarchaeota archaeon]